MLTSNNFAKILFCTKHECHLESSCQRKYSNLRNYRAASNKGSTGKFYPNLIKQGTKQSCSEENYLKSVSSQISTVPEEDCRKSCRHLYLVHHGTMKYNFVHIHNVMAYIFMVAFFFNKHSFSLKMFHYVIFFFRLLYFPVSTTDFRNFR